MAEEVGESTGETVTGPPRSDTRIPMSDVTHILNAIDEGDANAAHRLMPLVYDELRKLAAIRLANEPAGHSLQPTALVHEAWLRLVPDTPLATWNGRGHFFAAAAEAMRRILVEHARRRNAAKRGGGRRVDFDPDRLPAADRDEELVAVDEALSRLAAVEPKVAELVQLRYFGGLTVPEAAAALGVAPRTADAW